MSCCFLHIIFHYLFNVRFNVAVDIPPLLLSFPFLRIKRVWEERIETSSTFSVFFMLFIFSDDCRCFTLFLCRHFLISFSLSFLRRVVIIITYMWIFKIHTIIVFDIFFVVILVAFRYSITSTVLKFIFASSFFSFSIHLSIWIFESLLLTYIVFFLVRHHFAVNFPSMTKFLIFQKSPSSYNFIHGNHYLSFSCSFIFYCFTLSVEYLFSFLPSFPRQTPHTLLK